MTQSWLKAWWTVPRWRHVILEALVALCLAFLVWLYIHSRARETLDQVAVPVAIHLPPAQQDQYLLEIPGKPRVTATFSGPASRIREMRHKLQRSQVKITAEYTIPSDRQNEAFWSDVFRVDPAQVPVPPGVTVELVEETRAIPLTVHRVIERSLPVKLEYTGEARVTQLKVEPAVVLVRGPKTLLDRAQAMSTLPYAFAPPSDETSDPLVKDQATLATELDGRPVQVAPSQITFRCKVAPRKRVYELRDVPVHFLCPTRFPWRPRFNEERHGKIVLRLVGPAGEDPPPVLAYVDLTKGTFGRGRNLEPVRLQLPKDFQLADNNPLLVAFELEEMDRAAATTETVDP